MPSDDAPYIPIDIRGYRGIYNGAWVGAVVALMSAVYASLALFYVVKGSVSRDIDTGVGQILAATRLSKRLYIAGKWLSNFAILFVVVLLMILGAGVMQYIRGEDLTFDPWGLASPSLLIVLPIMAIVAAIAILFETARSLPGGFGNIVYFFTRIVFLFPIAQAGSFILENMQRGAREVFPDYEGGFSCCMMMKSQSLMVLGREDPTQQLFVWGGMDWSPGLLASRLILFLLALAIGLWAVRRFDRFDASESTQGRLARLIDRAGQRLGALGRSLLRRDRGIVTDATDAGAAPPEIRLTRLPAGASRYRFGRLLAAELRLLLKGLGWWWYLVAAGLIVAAFLTPLEIAHRWLLPLAWIWPVLLLSTLGTRDIQQHTNLLVFSTPHPLRRQLPVAWLADLILVVLTGSGVLARLLIAGDLDAAFTWLAAALFIPSLALALGTLSASPKLFQIVFMMLWYAGPMQEILSLDFMWLNPAAAIDSGVPYMYLALVPVLLVIAALGRRRQLRV